MGVCACVGGYVRGSVIESEVDEGDRGGGGKGSGDEHQGYPPAVG